MEIGFSWGTAPIIRKTAACPCPWGHVTGVQSFDKYRKTGENILPLLFSTEQ